MPPNINLILKKSSYVLNNLYKDYRAISATVAALFSMLATS